MNNSPVASPIAPQVFRFTDIDAFRSSVRHLAVDFTPLARKIFAEQTILSLPGCDVNFTKSFPRIIDAQLGPDCTAVGFLMDFGIPVRFNGVEEGDRSAIVIGGSGAAYSQVERGPRQYASIIFSPAIEGRGWPEAGPNFKIFETSASAHQTLRELVLQVLLVSSEPADAAEANRIAVGMRESLLAAIDNTFAEVVVAQWSVRANASRQFKVFRDVQAVLVGDVGHPIYSGDLARQIGVSVRTIHDAVQRYRGMSLHRYLRLRRLWLVRQRLLTGIYSVKDCALAFGFWHLSDFSRSYRLQFGETPSETIARSQRA